MNREGSPLQRQLPSLIVVTGRPGAGKTGLAHRLAPAIPCPVVSRDEIKEGLQVADSTLPEEEAKRAAYDAFFATLDLFLRRGVTVVAEAAFQHALWAEPLTRVAEIAQLRIVVCSIPPELALTRRLERMREDPRRKRFHPDPVVEAIQAGRSAMVEAYDPPHLTVPTLTIETSEGLRPSFETVLAFARGEVV